MAASKKEKVWRVADGASPHDGAAAKKLKPQRRARGESILRPSDRGRQVTRLLDLLRALENSRRGLTVQELIEQLELPCTPRTVYRDLEHLQGAGFALVRDGTRYRVEEKSLEVEPLRPSQVFALILADDLMSPLEGLPVERELQGLADSLRARLKPEGRAWIDGLRSLVVANRKGPLQQLKTPALDAIEEALVVEQPVRIEYAPPGRPSRTRIVEPHLLWCHGERAYLVAYCRSAEGFRTFALQRIHGVEMLDETFERREDFDPDEYVEQGFGALHGPQREVVVRFEPELAHVAVERTWHATQHVEHLDDGTVLLSMTAGGLPEIAAWVASFGGKVQALEPAELREAVRALHAAGLAAHGGSYPAQNTTDSDFDASPRETSRETPTSKKNDAASARLTSDDTGKA